MAADAIGPFCLAQNVEHLHPGRFPDSRATRSRRVLVHSGATVADLHRLPLKCRNGAPGRPYRLLNGRHNRHHGRQYRLRGHSCQPGCRRQQALLKVAVVASSVILTSPAILRLVQNPIPSAETFRFAQGAKRDFEKVMRRQPAPWLLLIQFCHSGFHRNDGPVSLRTRYS